MLDSLRQPKPNRAGSTDSRATIDVLTRTVEEERPDLASRAAPDGTVTILFSDIEGSTALNVELGDDRWMELLGEHNRLARTAIAEHRATMLRWRATPAWSPSRAPATPCAVQSTRRTRASTLTRSGPLGLESIPRRGP